jgi:DNA mismatch repair protein PMS2
LLIELLNPLLIGFLLLLADDPELEEYVLLPELFVELELPEENDFPLPEENDFPLLPDGLLPEENDDRPLLPEENDDRPLLPEENDDRPLLPEENDRPLLPEENDDRPEEKDRLPPEEKDRPPDPPFAKICGVSVKKTILAIKKTYIKLRILTILNLSIF